MGIVQDSLLGVMLFTRRSSFIDKSTVMNLIVTLERDLNPESQEPSLKLGLPIPAILKPKPLWTGK